MVRLCRGGFSRPWALKWSAPTEHRSGLSLTYYDTVSGTIIYKAMSTGLL